MPTPRHWSKLLFSVLLIAKAGFALTGDCNGDGVVDKRDSDMIANYLVGNLQNPPLMSCDLNSDGVVNVKDALIVLQFVSGLRPDLGGNPPQIIGVVPADNAVDVALSTPIHLFFSKSMDPSSVTSSNVRLLDSSSQQSIPVTPTFSQSNLILTLVPVAPLTASTTYQVIISTGLRDSTGMLTAAPFTSRFATAALGSLVILSGDAQSALIDSVLPNDLSVQAQDTRGLGVGGIPVKFKIVLGDGQFEPSRLREMTIATDSSGKAAVSLHVGGQATQQQVQVSAPGFSNSLVFTAGALASPAVSLRITMGTNQNCAVGSAVGVPLKVRAMDAGGNAVLGTTVTYRVTQGNGLFDGGLVTAVKVTDSVGAAETGFTCHSSGTVVVRADFPNLQGQAPQFSFQGLVPIPSTSTAVVGTVINHSLRPIEGIKVYLISDPSVNATTDAQGFFRLMPVPVGLQSIKIDAMHSTAADGKLYADLGYEVTVVQGQDNTFQMPALLPELDPASTLNVTGSQGGTLVLQADPRWQLMVNPGQAIFPNGTTTGKLWVTAVPADKIPMPPADGKYSSVFVAVEPPNVKFNPPAQVTFPNVDNNPPGAVLDIVSFDHNVGMFLAIGKGKVSDDGQTITSLPGSGLVHGGWHYTAPPVPGPSTNVIGTIQGCHSSIAFFGNSFPVDPNTGIFSGFTGVPQLPPFRLPGFGQNEISGKGSCQGEKKEESECEPEREKELQQAVHDLCDRSGRLACTSRDDCATIKSKLLANANCLAARKQVMDECYNGGDQAHKNEYNRRVTTYNNCVNECMSQRHNPPCQNCPPHKGFL